MSVGVIKKGEYKIAAKVGGMKELKDINLYTGNQNVWDLLHGTNIAAEEDAVLSTTADYDFVGPEYVIPADGLYWFYCSCRLWHTLDRDVSKRVIVSNKYTIKINGTLLPSFWSMRNTCDSIAQFAIPLKKGTRVQVAYHHDGELANDGYIVRLYGFIQQLNQ